MNRDIGYFMPGHNLFWIPQYWVELPWQDHRKFEHYTVVDMPALAGPEQSPSYCEGLWGYPYYDNDTPSLLTYKERRYLKFIDKKMNLWRQELTMKKMARQEAALLRRAGAISATRPLAN
jgi:hypothetical protein